MNLPIGDYGQAVEIGSRRFTIGAWYEIKPGHFYEHGPHRLLEVFFLRRKVHVLTRGQNKIKTAAWSPEEWAEWASDRVQPA